MSNEETIEMRKTNKVSSADEGHKDDSYENTTTRPLPKPPQNSTDKSTTTSLLGRQKIPPIGKKSESTGKPKDETQQSDEASPEGTGKPKDETQENKEASPEGTGKPIDETQENNEASPEGTGKPKDKKQQKDKVSPKGTGKPKNETQENNEASPEGTGIPKDKKQRRDKPSPKGTGKSKDVTQQNAETSPEGTGKPKDETQENDKDSPEGTGKPKGETQENDKDSPEGGNVKRQGERGAYVLLPVKAVLMVAAFVLVFSSTDLSMDNPCELKEALDLISLNYAPFCKYNATIEESVKVQKLGIAVIIFHVILFLVILSAYMWPSESKDLGLLIIYVLVFILATVFLPLLVIQYNDINDAKQNPEHQLDNRRLKSEMLRSLENNFKSDNPGDGNTVSSGWNKIFIKYNCCAVNDVNGTTNDFDNTPWCTTAGSCQDTASQIPRTCCKDVTQDDYQNAPGSCHASVNPGTYKPGCFQIVKSMSLAKVEYYQVLVLALSLSTLLTLQILDVVLAFVILVFVTAAFCKTRRKETKASV